MEEEEANQEELDKQLQLLQTEINKITDEIAVLEHHTECNSDSWEILLDSLSCSGSFEEPDPSFGPNFTDVREMMKHYEIVNGIKFTNFRKEIGIKHVIDEDKCKLDAYWVFGEIGHVMFHVNFKLGSEAGEIKMIPLKIIVSDYDNLNELKELIEISEQKKDLSLFFKGLNDFWTLSQRRKEVIEMLRDYAACIGVRPLGEGGFSILALSTELKEYFGMTWRIKYNSLEQKMMSEVNINVSNYGKTFYEREQELFDSACAGNSDSLVDLWKTLAHAVLRQCAVDEVRRQKICDIEDFTALQVRRQMRNLL